jgi:hypothetical protein
MKGTTALYVVQRQPADAPEWSRVTCCDSLAYAELIAATGIRRQIGSRYRAIQVGSGAKVALGCAQNAKAA